MQTENKFPLAGLGQSKDQEKARVAWRRFVTVIRRWKYPSKIRSVRTVETIREIFGGDLA